MILKLVPTVVIFAAWIALGHAASCTTSPLEQFANLAENEKLLWIQMEKTDGGKKVNVRCGARGPTKSSEGNPINVVQDPTVWYNQVIGNVDFSSVMPCRFLSFVLRAGATKGPGAGSTAVPTGAAGTCGAKRPYSGDCKYPGIPSTETRWPEGKFLGKDDQRSWVGAVYSIASINGKSLDEMPETVTHENIHGVSSDDAKYCTDEEGNDGPVMDGKPVIYNGGLMITNKRGTDFTMRSFMFKNPAIRTAAMKSDKNIGLPFAKVFKGANGCDAEIVYEFSPASGGGLDFSVAFPLMAWSQEAQQDLRDSVLAYQTTDEVVISVSTHALRRAHNLDFDAACDPTTTEIVRVAKSLVCAKTSQRINATIKARIKNSAGNEAQVDVSTNLTNPTSYRPQTGVVVHTNPTITDDHGFELSFSLTATEAPVSCEKFYWDPLVQPISGDGNSATAVIGLTGLQIALIVIGVFVFLAIIGTTVAYKSKRACFRKKGQSEVAMTMTS